MKDKEDEVIKDGFKTGGGLGYLATGGQVSCVGACKTRQDWQFRV